MSTWFIQCCVLRILVLMDILFCGRNFWIHHEHNELWLLLIICLNNIVRKDHCCVVSSWCDGAYGRTYYLLVFVKASVV